MAIEPVTYEAGDMLVFAGKGWISKLITWGTNPFRAMFGRGSSHIGICANYQGRVLLFESTTLSNMTCEVTGKPVRGVKAVDPALRVESYEGKAWVLKPGPDQKLTDDTDRQLTDYLVSKCGTPYEDFDTLVVAGSRYLKRHWLFRENTDKLFCSELCGLVLELIRWIAPTNSSALTPSGLEKLVTYDGTYQTRRLIK
jgi:hypothetical protein